MRDWPHSPAHRLTQAGAYMVTAGTYRKELFFGSADRLTLVCDSLLKLAEEYGWSLQAWAVFPNHYHFVATCSSHPKSLRALIRHLHSLTAREINRLDQAQARKVWFQYWDSHLTYAKSYLCRLSYVHNNAVHHGLVLVPSAYAWCSAAWFERHAGRAFYQTVMRFPHDRINVPDDYTVNFQGA